MSKPVWVEARLGDLGRFSTSSVDKKRIEGQQRVRLVNYMDVYRTNKIDSNINFMEVTASQIETVRSQVEVGDVLFTPSSETPDDIGHSAVVSEELKHTLHSYHTVRFRPNSNQDIDLRFSAWFASSEKILKQFYKKCSGSTRYTLTIPAFESVMFEYPQSLDAQKKIAMYLDTINLAIEKTEALIEKYQQIKVGLMHDLFTRGITADGKLRPPREQAPELYQETAIGWIPKDWGVDEFGGKISIIDPNPSHRYPAEVSEGIPICSTENFDEEDDFFFRKSKLVPEKTYIEQNNRCRFHSNDVVFARKGKIGLARRYGQEKKVFSHTVVIMKPNGEETDSCWLLWLTRSDWLLKAIDVTMNTNSGVPTLGVAFIKGIEVPFPMLNEQKSAALKLDAVSQVIQAKVDNRNKLRRLKSGLMHDLLTGKVPVTVDKNEAIHAD